MNSGKSDMTAMLKQLENPPKRMIPSRAPLVKFSEAYLKLYDLNATPPTSLDSYVVTAKKLEDEFRKSGKELKAGMPPKIADKLKESATKFKDLSDL
jgi:hypothetical protein